MLQSLLSLTNCGSRGRNLFQLSPHLRAWSQIQLGLPLEQQNYLDELAHGLVTKGALAWVCELVNKASGGTVSPEPQEEK